MSGTHRNLSMEIPRAGTLMSPPPPPLPSNIPQPRKTPSVGPSTKIPYLSESEDSSCLNSALNDGTIFSEESASHSNIRKRKSLVERQKSRFDRLFNETSYTLSRPASPQIPLEEEEDGGVYYGFGNVDSSESHNLLKGCYASIASLRVEIDGWQTRARDAQSRALSLEEDKRLLIAERNILQQRLLEAEQDSSTQRSRAQALSAEIDTLDLEVDKLRRDNHRLRKLAYRQDECDGRVVELEEMLGESQRVATIADARYQRLLLQNEKLKKAHRKLQQSSQRGGTEAEVYEKVAWLRESNDKLQFALGDIVNMSLSSDAPTSQMTMLVGVIQQLIDDNGRLKSDAMGYCDLIADIQAENQHMRGQFQASGSAPCPNSVCGNLKAPSRLKLRRRSSLTPGDKRHTTLLEELKKCGAPSESLPNSPFIHKCQSVIFNRCDSSKRESGIFTTNTPLKHLYQDEWMSVSDESEADETAYSRMQTPIPTILKTTTTTKTHPKPSTKPAPAPHVFYPYPFGFDSQAPLENLVSQAKSLLDRLQASEPKTLNRKLQRSFNLPELAPISNTLICNIQQNIELLPVKFQAFDTSKKDRNAATNHRRSISSGSSLVESDQGRQFWDLVHLVQNLLEEVSNLRMGINHLSLAFVDKMNNFSQAPCDNNSSYHWPIHTQPQPPSIIRCIPPSPQNSTLPQHTSRRHSFSTPDSLLHMSPMQVRNGVVDYSPRISVTLDPALVVLPLTPPDLTFLPIYHPTPTNSIEYLRKLVARESRAKLNSTKPSPSPAPIVSTSCEHVERAAVICHTYSLMGHGLPTPATSCHSIPDALVFPP